MIQSQLIPNGQFEDALNTEKSFNNDFLDMCFMDQSHSDIFIEVDKPGKYKADALITKKRSLALVVLTADCMPVLICDDEKIGIIHIGWKGLENNIFYKTISSFNLQKLKVSIGPHAQKCCYEVKEDLETKFSKHCLRIENKIYLDLSKEIKDFCQENKLEIEVSNICTIENQKYNSYRRNKTQNRQRSFLWI
tara:strand:- start:3164 stop:3742 length:579 start_codon:yes stop_codon:yes gene_type:complete